MLKVWWRAMELVVEAYGVAARLPPGEQFDLARQLRRCAVSIPANMAEGYGRHHSGEYLHHLAIANGSLAELQTLLLIAERVGYAPAEQVSRPLELAAETERMLAALRRAVRAGRPKSTRSRASPRAPDPDP